MKSDNIGKQPSATHRKVMEYWILGPGMETWVDADKRLKTKIVSKMTSIDHDYPQCWACHVAVTKWSSLERCHIIPRSSGGGGKADNLILMCRSCHIESPTINDADSLWFWLSHKRTINEIRLELLSEIMASTNLSFIKIAEAVIDIMRDESITTGGGRLSPYASIAILRSRLSRLEANPENYGSRTMEDANKASDVIFEFFDHLRKD
jgi:hypothetical protein